MMDLGEHRRSEIIGMWGVGVGLLGGAALAVFVPSTFNWPEWTGLPIYFANQLLFGWVGVMRAEHLTGTH